MNFSFTTVPFLGVAITWLLTAIVHIAFAMAIWEDAELLWRHFRRKTFFVGGGIWALATLMGGVVVAGLYWAIHHSTLRLQNPEIETPTRPPASR